MARILVVDDSPTDTYVLKSILEKGGHQVSTAKNGEAGLKAAQSMQPDLILMDVVMPGMNGFQATRQLTRQPETSHIPVIIITTKDAPTDKVWASRQGATDYLVKPVSEKELLVNIESKLAC